MNEDERRWRPKHLKMLRSMRLKQLATIGAKFHDISRYIFETIERSKVKIEQDFFFQIHLIEDEPWIWVWKNLSANSEIFWFCCDMSGRNICALQVFFTTYALRSMYNRHVSHHQNSCPTPVNTFCIETLMMFIVHTHYTPYQAYQSRSQNIQAQCWWILLQIWKVESCTLDLTLILCKKNKQKKDFKTVFDAQIDEI